MGPQLPKSDQRALLESSDTHGEVTLSKYSSIYIILLFIQLGRFSTGQVHALSVLDCNIPNIRQVPDALYLQRTAFHRLSNRSSIKYDFLSHFFSLKSPTLPKGRVYR